jgi:ketosteroid isomerase-like protein
MSEENVERVRRVCAGWERGDLSAGLDLFDSEIRFESFMPDSQRTVFATGLHGIEEFMREFLGAWRDYRFIADHFLDAGDKVFVEGRQAAIGRQSGVEVEMTIYSIWTFGGENLVALKFTPHREEALEAAGLSE